MSFNIRFLDARVWRYSLSAVADLVDVGSFRVSDDGFRIRAMDPSHVALIEFSIPREGFEVFDVEGEANVPISIEAVAKILKRASKRDELVIGYDGKSAWVSLATPHGFERRFSVPVLHGTAVEEVPELKIDFPVSASMHPQVFHSSYKIISEIGEVLTLQSTPEGVKITGSSELAEAEILLTKDTGGLIEHNHSSDNVERASYTIDYFDKIAKASSIAEEALIDFGSDKPCKVTISMPRGARLVLYVAPRSE